MIGKIMTEEGMVGFYKGISINLLKVRLLGAFG